MEIRDIVSIAAVFFIALINIGIAIYLAFSNNRFNKRLVNIKSELGLLTQNKLSLDSEERNAIIAYHNAYSNYHNIVFEVGLQLNHYINIEKLNNIRQQILLARYEYKNSENRIKLFINDEKLTPLCIELMTNLYNYSFQYETLIFELEIYIKRKEFEDIIAIADEHCMEIINKNRDVDFSQELENNSSFSLFKMRKYLSERLMNNINRNRNV